jgi:hypothetical protein
MEPARTQRPKRAAVTAEPGDDTPEVDIRRAQCASCKSFILDGDDTEHDRYSTFALPDYEKDEGYTLLCRAHAYEDVTIELLNDDEDMIRRRHRHPAPHADLRPVPRLPGRR